MSAIDTSNLSESEFVSTFPAEACTELGADESYTSRQLDLGPMQMLAPLLVTAVLGVVSFVSLLAWGLR